MVKKSYKHIKFIKANGVATVSLDRPDKRNAFFPEMIQEIKLAFDDIARDQTARAVVLTGEGKSFCSGGDLEWMRSMAKFTRQQNVRDAEQLFAMYSSIRNCPVPVIGKVFGHCFGGGAGLTAACDIVLAETSTQFCFSEVKWGLIPAVISPFVMEKAQPAWVREWFLTAKVFLAEEARVGGLVQYVGTPSDLERELARRLELLQAAAPLAVRATKKLLHSYSPIKWASVRARVTTLIASARVSPEGQFGLAAFLNKQNPQWSDLKNGTAKKN